MDHGIDAGSHNSREFLVNDFANAHADNNPINNVI